MRNRSALLTLEGLPNEATVDGPRQLRREIFESVTKNEIKAEEIDGIECFSKTRWFVVFRDEETRDRHLNTKIELYEQDFQLEHPNPPKPEQPKYVHVYIYGYPIDEDTETLTRAMSYYGPIVTTNDVIDQRIKIKTGVKDLAYEHLNKDIPSYLYVGGNQIRTQYYDQPKTCRNCHKTGHIARDCTAGKVCRECGEPGHVKYNCPQQRCYDCHETGHRRANCTNKNNDDKEKDEAEKKPKRKSEKKRRAKIDTSEIEEGSDNDGDDEDTNPSEYETEEEDNDTPTAEPDETVPMTVEKPDLKRARSPEKEQPKEKGPTEEESYLEEMVKQRTQRHQTNETDIGTTTQAKKRTRVPISMGKNRNPWTQN